MYTPIDIYTFISAYSGAYAGMAVSGRSLRGNGTQPQTQADFAGLALSALAFAEEFDTLAGGYGDNLYLDVSIAEACEGYWRERGAQSTAPADYENDAMAILLAILEGQDVLVDAGIDIPPTPTGGGGGGAGSAGYVIWRPGGVVEGQVVTTLAEVQAAIGNGASVVFVDSSIADATIESGETLDLGGFVVLASYSIIGTFLTVADGGTILDLAIVDGLALECQCTTTPALSYSTPEFVLLMLINSASMALLAGASVPAYKALDGQTFLVESIFSILQSASDVPFFSCASGGTLYLIATALSFCTAGIAGDEGGNLIVNTDASCPVSFATNAADVTINYQDEAEKLVWWSSNGPPTVLDGVTLSTGAMYFDTGLQAPQWWNGATWVGSESHPYVIWAPGESTSGQTVGTWADVVAAIEAGVRTVVVNTGAGDAHVDVGGESNVQGVSFQSYDGSAQPVFVDDGNTLLGLTDVGPGVVFAFTCETGAGMSYAGASGHPTYTLTIDLLGGIILADGSTQPLLNDTTGEYDLYIEGSVQNLSDVPTAILSNPSSAGAGQTVSWAPPPGLIAIGNEVGCVAGGTFDYYADASNGIPAWGTVAGTYNAESIDKAVNLDWGEALVETVDAGNQEVLHVKTLTFNSEIANGDSGAAFTVDWTLGQKQSLILTADTTLTFDAPPGVCNTILRLVQDGTGDRAVTWPAGVRWLGGAVPALNTSAGSESVVALYWNNDDWYGQGGGYATA